jgi:hypothetical protein
LPVKPLARISLILAFFIMIWPIEADILNVMLIHRSLAVARTFTTVCFLVVFTPFILSWQRLHRNPGKWRGRGYLIAAGVILTFNIIGVCFWSFAYVPHK